MEDTAENRSPDQPGSPENYDDRRHATDHQGDDGDNFGCGECGAVFGDRHRLFLVRHREWHVDECSHCGKQYQVGRATGCLTRLQAQSGIEIEVPVRAWLAVNSLLHHVGLISFPQFEAMELDIGAGPDAEQSEWISTSLRNEIKAAGGPRAFVARKTKFEGETGREFFTYLKQFIRFARKSDGFSVY